MAQINLLPWREELRQEKKKEFLTHLASVCILTALVGYAWISSVNNAIASQNSRNNMLDSEIKVLAKQVEEIKNLKKERQALLDRMNVIQDLEGKRSIIVHYFDEFAKAVPDGVYITEIERKGDIFSVVGVSESNNRLSSFMRELDDSDWFSNTNLLSTSSSPSIGEQARVFSLDLKAVLPKTSEESDG